MQNWKKMDAFIKTVTANIVYYVLCKILSILPMSIYLSTILWGKWYYYLHFIDEQAKHWEVKVICPVIEYG